MIVQIFAFWIPLILLLLWFGVCLWLAYLMVKTDSIHDKTYFQQTVDYIRSVLNV